VGRHRTTKRIYAYRGKRVTFDQLAAKAKKFGVNRIALQSRIGGGWKAQEAAEWPLGKIRTRMKGRSKAGRGETAWGQVLCPVEFCRAHAGQHCILPDRSRRGHPHAERKERARKDDFHLVPKDWEARLDAVVLDRLREFDRVMNLQDSIQDLVSSGVIQRVAAESLGISLAEASELLNGSSYGRKPSILEYRPKALVRPPSGKVTSSEARLAGSWQACGGGWRVLSGPREDRDHTGRV
jgi:hypothetical protein